MKDSILSSDAFQDRYAAYRQLISNFMIILLSYPYVQSTDR
jgi:hypothetical protein